MTAARWEDLPSPRAKTRPAGAWRDLLLELGLKKRRGQWMRVAEFEHQRNAYDAARNINSKRVILPDGRWEAAARTVDGRFYVYVRYLGK
jgi:hypothetical protein